MARRFSKKSFKFKTGIRKVNVPSLSGLSRSQAKTTLESVGLTWTETSSVVQNVNLNDTIENQGIASGTTVNIGTSISFTYYLYVAPPPPIIATPPPIIAVPPPIIAVPPPIISAPPTCTLYQLVSQGACQWNPIFGICARYNTYYNSDCTTFQELVGCSGCTPPAVTCGECVGYVTMSPTCNGEDVYQGYYSAYGRSCSDGSTSTAGCPSGGQFQYFGNLITANSRSCGGSGGTPPPPIISTPPPIIASPPPIIASPPPIIASPPPIISFSKSVSVSTLVRTPTGLVRAENLNVGDVLLSADLEGFPYTPGEGVTEEALAWTAENPNLNIVNTTIVEISRRTATKAVMINGDIFSQYHWILVKRNGITQFIRSEDIIEGTDYIFDAESNLWEIVDLFEIINITHETISINCEPYDMFFTEKMLTHDSFPI